MNDPTTQKVHSNSCNGQSILSERLHSKIVTYAGLTDETTFVFWDLGIWRRHKQNFFISWFAKHFHQSMNDGWQIHHHRCCGCVKGRHDRHGLGLTKDHWHGDWKQIHAGNRQAYHATKANRIQCENKKHGLWRILIVTVIVRIVMWNISRLIKTNSNQRRNGSRKRMIEQNIFEFAFTMFFHACKMDQGRFIVDPEYWRRFENKNFGRTWRHSSMENRKRLTVANYTKGRNKKNFVTFTGFCGRDFNACLFWIDRKKRSNVLLRKNKTWKQLHHHSLIKKHLIDWKAVKKHIWFFYIKSVSRKPKSWKDCSLTTKGHSKDCKRKCRIWSNVKMTQSECTHLKNKKKPIKTHCKKNFIFFSKNHVKIHLKKNQRRVRKRNDKVNSRCTRNSMSKINNGIWWKIR